MNILVVGAGGVGAAAGAIAAAADVLRPHVLADYDEAASR